MDNKFYISYKVARLLKEKGYNEVTDYIIDEDNCMLDSHYLLNEDLPEYICSCPTKAEAINWLESKGIVISVEYINGLWDCQIYSFVDATILHGKALPMVYDVVNFSTRLEAEEAAIIKALELL